MSFKSIDEVLGAHPIKYSHLIMEQFPKPEQVTIAKMMTRGKHLAVVMGRQEGTTTAVMLGATFMAKHMGKKVLYLGNNEAATKEIEKGKVVSWGSFKNPIGFAAGESPENFKDYDIVIVDDYFYREDIYQYLEWISRNGGLEGIPQFVLATSLDIDEWSYATCFADHKVQLIDLKGVTYA